MSTRDTENPGDMLTLANTREAKGYLLQAEKIRRGVLRQCYAEMREEHPGWRAWDTAQMVSAANERFGKYEKEAKQ